MIEEFKIYIDRLKRGDVQKVEGNFAPDLLDLEEDEFQFNYPVKVRAEAYLADDHLVLNFSALTAFETPCAICSEFTKKQISVTNDYHTVPLSEIRAAVYDFGIALREALLVELPQVVECNNGDCPMRHELLKQDELKKKPNGNFPFSDLK
jgi:hypothetical protein